MGEVPLFLLPARAAAAIAMDLRAYRTDGFWDELFDEHLRPRPGAEQLVRRLAEFSSGELAARQRAADKALLTMGITFNVYGHEAGTEKIRVPPSGPREAQARGSRAAHQFVKG